MHQDRLPYSSCPHRQEGDLPRIAITSGVCDQLTCILPKLGIDTADLGVSGDDKIVTYFAGYHDGLNDNEQHIPFVPPNMREAIELWSNEAELDRYDIALLSCECSPIPETKTAASFAAMTNYLAKGGRIFSTHYQYLWLESATDPALAQAVSFFHDYTEGRSPMRIDTSFSKAKAMADWMKFVDPTVNYGQIGAADVANNLRSVMPPAATVWASSAEYLEPPNPGSDRPCPSGGCPRIVTVNVPVGVPADKQCGRVVYMDAHITDFRPAEPSAKFPQTCGTKQSKGEEALAFLLFDLAACLQIDNSPIEPPVVVP